MRFLARAAAVAAAGAAIASCTVEVDLEDKACPCGDDYVCDPFGDTCVAKLCEVTADELVIAWATPHSLAFEWGPAGDASAFHEYELVIATSEEAARDGTGDARTHTLSQNPALESFDANDDQPMFTVVGDLTPGTEYFARLTITANNGCTSRSAILAETTPPLPLKPIVLFDDATGVSVAPETAEIVGSGTDAYVEYELPLDPSCTGADLDPFCGQPVKLDFEPRILGEEGGPGNLVEEGELGRAYLEIVLFYESSFPARFGTVFLSPAWPEGSTEMGNFRFDVASFSLEPSSAYHSLEIPLTRLHLSEGSFRPLTHDDLLSLPFGQAAIGGQWHEASVVRIDAIRIQH